jgi:hypothetical protein
MFEVFSVAEEQVLLVDNKPLQVMNFTFENINDVRKTLSANGGVYCWYNTATKKVYIGSSINLWRRFKSYKQIFLNDRSNRINQAFINSIKFRGVKAYKFFILELFNGTVKEVRDREQFYLDKYQPFFKEGRGYNFSKSAISSKPSPLSEEGRKKIRERHSGENSESAKLNNESVLNIKIRLSQGCNLITLAKEYGVSTTVISNIKSGKTWKNIKCDQGVEDILKRLCYNNRKGKLTPDLVREIKIRIKNGEKCFLLAREYNLPYTTIHGLKIEHYYKNIII